jgi:xanthine dehydrogenase YagS FAD-binding subunit
VNPFDYAAPADVHAAVALVADRPGATFLAGGTNLVDHLRLGIAAPDLLVDVRQLTSRDIVETEGGDLLVGAAVTNSELAGDRRVRERWPVLAEALLAGASGQLRNLATTGGNALQRTRCVYFQDVSTPCNKRLPGSGCSAVGGYTRYHAVLGTGEPSGTDSATACIATHPSDMAVALAAIGADVHVLGADGERTVPFTDLHRLPGDQPDRDTVLRRDELITAITLPALQPGTRSTYRKIRDRRSYAFALVSVAAVVDLGDDGTVRDVRIALGGVAHKPWRARRAEDVLRGRPASVDAFREAARAELADAIPQPGIDGGNAFKVTLVERTIVAVLRDLTGTTEEAR